MNASKEVPSWFKLENYDAAKTFTAAQWVHEIDIRLTMRSALASKVAISDPSSIDAEDRAFALAIVDVIKARGLIGEDLMASLSPESAGRMRELMKAYGQHEDTTASVKSLSVFEAWIALCESNRFEKINQELKERPRDEKGWAQIYAKYSHPLSMVDSPYKFDIGRQRFAVVNLEAADRQIMQEFSAWLSEQRSNYHDLPISKILFSPATFLGWHEAGILPYFDLTTISEIENKKIPRHVIADALFPNEIDVDVVERVRKGTKEKVSQVFQLATLWPLVQYAQLELLKAE